MSVKVLAVHASGIHDQVYSTAQGGRGTMDITGLVYYQQGTEMQLNPNSAQWNKMQITSCRILLSSAE